MTATAAQPLAKEIGDLLASLPKELGALNSCPTLPENVASIIDHTLLAPTATPSAILETCREAVELGAATVCVNSCMVQYAAEALRGTEVRPICTVGFPFGAASPASKAEETRQAVADGAREIDMVQNVGLLKSGDYDAVYNDIVGVVDAAKTGQAAPVKVILETCYLSRDEIAIATLLSCLAGAAFVKTSTGYGTGGAKAEDIRLMYEIASKRKVQVKASGAVRTLETVKTMVANGATRVGASGTKAIVAEAQGTGDAKQASNSGY
ncbi:deoxyribose-phosphate aldolase [Acaromyces ingoldii]|uniref:deoxyribose-phosphate aldolase n=1 Tax=Acaromyces ingoldii TaxID=215250 RepID=A0A316YFK3_9BASI|nr:deoxyribose-phosphate aldolase [Acaromyces ingoldii]PWN88197.1 deoxyribose-phosphate aldolase [Acaromyces ingoldii]